MKRIFSLFVALSFVLTSACSHQHYLTPFTPSTNSATPITISIPATTTFGTNPLTTTQLSPTQLGILNVYFIDVGQGDAILIDQGSIEILIDGGERQPGVVQFIKQYVQGDLEVIIATHPHADHIGGLIDVLNNYKVDQVWYNGESSTTKTYSDFIAAANADNAQMHIVRRGDKITAGALTLEVLNPFDLSGTTNNNSIVTELDYGNVDFLFEGDAEQESEARMLAATDILLHPVDVLKVGHHGSRTASSPPFLAKVRPETAVYMAGVGNMYGHPHIETINALNAIGSKIFGTDVKGTITITTDGAIYDVLSQK